MRVFSGTIFHTMRGPAELLKHDQPHIFFQFMHQLVFQKVTTDDAINMKFNQCYLSLSDISQWAKIWKKVQYIEGSRTIYLKGWNQHFFKFSLCGNYVTTHKHYLLHYFFIFLAHCMRYVIYIRIYYNIISRYLDI